jgi:hypothetical protein
VASDADLAVAARGGLTLEAIVCLITRINCR